jgi:hypothetical protein
VPAIVAAGRLRDLALPAPAPRRRRRPERSRHHRLVRQLGPDRHPLAAALYGEAALHVTLVSLHALIC